MRSTISIAPMQRLLHLSRMVVVTALSGGILFFSSGCAGVWMNGKQLPLPSKQGQPLSFDDKTQRSLLKPNQCGAFLIRPTMLYDVGFVACRTVDTTVEVTCTTPRTGPKVDQKTGEIICGTKTIKTTTVTKLTFPIINSQGFAGPITTVLAAGVAATAAIAVAKP